MSKVKLTGSFDLEFQTEQEMNEFLASIHLVGNIKYKAYKELYGEEKLFNEIEYNGELKED